MGILDDPRGRESSRLAFLAEQALRADDPAAAHLHYARAAALEAELLAEVPQTERRIRSALAVSAVALWFKAEEHARVLELAARLLGEPDALTTDARRELRELHDDAVAAAETAARKRVILENFNLHDTERLLCEIAVQRTATLTEAAAQLGITPKALKRRMAKYRIKAPRRSDPADPRPASPRDPDDPR